MGEDEKKEEGRRVYQLMAYNMAVDGIDGRTDRWPWSELPIPNTFQEDESERIHAKEPVEGTWIGGVKIPWRKVRVLSFNWLRQYKGSSRKSYEENTFNVVMEHQCQGSWKLQGEAAEHPR